MGDFIRVFATICCLTWFGFTFLLAAFSIAIGGTTFEEMGLTFVANVFLIQVPLVACALSISKLVTLGMLIAYVAATLFGG